jgi:hypothetical protein
MEAVLGRAKPTAVECTGRALTAIEEARGHLEQAAECLSKVEGMALERQRLQKLRKHVGRAFFLVDARRTHLRRQGALRLEESGAERFEHGR